MIVLPWRCPLHGGVIPRGSWSRMVLYVRTGDAEFHVECAAKVFDGQPPHRLIIRETARQTVVLDENRRPFHDIEWSARLTPAPTRPDGIQRFEDLPAPRPKHKSDFTVVKVKKGANRATSSETH